MDVYVNQLVGSGQPHDLFYTNAKVMVRNSQILHIDPNLTSSSQTECLSKLCQNVRDSLLERAYYHGLGTWCVLLHAICGPHG